MQEIEKVIKIVFPSIAEINSYDVHELAILKLKVQSLEEFLNRKIRAMIQT